MNLQQARINMVEQQVRPWEVLDQRVLDLLEASPRDEYVPDGFRELAYADIEIPLPDGESMLPPRIEGRLLQALRLTRSDRALEIGTGSGYLASLLASLAGHLTSVEISPTLAALGRTNLERHRVGNVTLETGDAARGWDRDAPYDAIAVTGSIPVLDEGLREQLAIGGRLFVVVGEHPAMEAQVITRAGEREFATESLFETVLPPLRGVSRPRRFVL